MNPGGRSGWTVRDWAGSAAEFHSLDVHGPRSVWLCEVTAPALVLGSSQPDSDVDSEVARRTGLDIVRRRTGGGAVYVHPTESIWIDVTIDRDDPLWVDDVSASMTWLGEVFVRALSPWVGASVHTGVFGSGVDGRVVCFASAAPGEVFVDDRKLVGISQRRGRSGARFQCVIYRAWSPAVWADVIADPGVRGRIDGIAVATIGASGRELMDSLVRALPH